MIWIYIQMYSYKILIIFNENPFLFSYVLMLIFCLIWIFIAFKMQKNFFAAHKNSKEGLRLCRELQANNVFKTAQTQCLIEARDESRKEHKKDKETLKVVRTQRDLIYTKHRNKIQKQEKIILAYRLAHMSWGARTTKKTVDDHIAAYKRLNISKLKKIEKDLFDAWFKDHVSSQKYWKKTKTNLKKSKK